VKIPDLISPIVGHRVWRWDTNGLKSLNGEPWSPGKPLAARCRAGNVHDADEPPQADCTCGVYAAKSLDHLHKIGLDRYGVLGEVNLWGSVVEHELGYRAQFAYPKSLVLPPDALPFALAEIQSRLEMLAAYRAGILVAGPKGGIPLWTKHSGLNPTGLDYLIERSKQHHDRRRQEQTLKKGDRVAILGRGIAVVELVDGKGVHAVLRNKIMLRIGRKEVVWDEGNMRWETDANAPFESVAGRRVPPHRGQL
jgi:hypothetical protein